MAKSVENGDFWLYLAATPATSLTISIKYYGDSNGVADLLELLSEEEQAKIKPLVSSKAENADGTFQEQRTIAEMAAAYLIAFQNSIEFKIIRSDDSQYAPPVPGRAALLQELLAA